MQKYRSIYGNTCDKIESEETLVPPKDGIIFYAEAADDTGLFTAVKTGPLFGCVNFEKVE